MDGPCQSKPEKPPMSKGAHCRHAVLLAYVLCLRMALAILHMQIAQSFGAARNQCTLEWLPRWRHKHAQ
eukprot:9022958-Karenia_brevis.AAC.1